MEQTQRSRTKSVNAPSQEERRMLKALKKSADEAKQMAPIILVCAYLIRVYAIGFAA